MSHLSANDPRTVGAVECANCGGLGSPNSMTLDQPGPRERLLCDLCIVDVMAARAPKCEFCGKPASHRVPEPYTTDGTLFLCCACKDCPEMDCEWIQLEERKQ